ncbi:MAG: DUF1648 domain-containing protein [Proteobacteria bacterium]|nr:MAG: DUF1648 domain-containing protein [Pseudomonadota bacterium]
MNLHLTKPRWVYTPLMKVTDLVCLLVLGWMFYYLWSVQSELPNLIPTHFGLNGNADRFGPNGSLLILPGITAFLYFVTLLARFDARFINFPVKVTEESASDYFPVALQMLTLIQLFVVCFLGMLLHQIIEVSLSRQPGLPVWGVGLFIGSLLTIICFYFVKLNRL